MRIPRVYQSRPLSLGQVIELDAQATAHLTKVLRLRVGDALVIFNGEGGEYGATVVAIERRAASIKISEFVDHNVESPLELVLVQGVSRGERMDFVQNPFLPPISRTTSVGLSSNASVMRATM